MLDRRKTEAVFKIKQENGTFIEIEPSVPSASTSLLKIIKLLFEDLFSSISRSQDFNNTRAEYLRLRVTVLSVVMSILFLLWIPIERLMLDMNIATALAWERAITASFLIIIAFLAPRGTSLRHVQLMITALILVLNIFSIMAQHAIGGSNSQGLIFGYSLFPYLYIAILSIFPQTAVEGLRLSSITIIFVAVKHYLNGTVMSFTAFSDFWFLSLLTVVILSSQMGQMQMMLRLYRQGTRDPLTGLFNRGRLMNNIKLVTDFINRSKESDDKVALMMFDLDFFKKINDTYGHSSGDDVLVGFSQLLTSSVRTIDIVGRYGGEEFIAVMINIREKDALVVAERIRKNSEATLVETRSGHKINFTTSIGIAFYEKGEEISSLIERADKNLYKAKFEGRNRVHS